MVPYVHILFYGINIAAKMNDIRNFVQAVKRKQLSTYMSGIVDHTSPGTRLDHEYLQK